MVSGTSRDEPLDKVNRLRPLPDEEDTAGPCRLGSNPVVLTGVTVASTTSAMRAGVGEVVTRREGEREGEEDVGLTDGNADGNAVGESVSGENDGERVGLLVSVGDPVVGDCVNRGVGLAVVGRGVLWHEHAPNSSVAGLEKHQPCAWSGMLGFGSAHW